MPPKSNIFPFVDIGISISINHKFSTIRVEVTSLLPTTFASIESLPTWLFLTQIKELYDFFEVKYWNILLLLRSLKNIYINSADWYMNFFLFSISSEKFYDIIKSNLGTCETATGGICKILRRDIYYSLKQ